MIYLNVAIAPNKETYQIHLMDGDELLDDVWEFPVPDPETLMKFVTGELVRKLRVWPGNPMWAQTVVVDKGLFLLVFKEVFIPVTPEYRCASRLVA